ncbi:hypothetical protein [Terrimonas pollutisoli]|uniref:hypothetical protein n=1 Tax=Terrimonas pollutisoli TaxID=3034147 RepID=UPI0023EC3C46|nr:hypothetical protein [Terrimonas sp. H1YJ31]
MEISGTAYHIIKRKLAVCLVILLMLAMSGATAQETVKAYTVKNGRMFIALSKNLSEASIDSFIAQYDLGDLSLKQFIKGVYIDSLKKLGWKLDLSNSELFVISKKLGSYDDLSNPANKIMLTDKHASIAQRFPAVSNRVVYGYNNFKNKKPFATNDSVVTFFLRNNKNAERVMLAGSFNNWDPKALAMTKTDSGWIALVKLGPGKYWYKFIVDGNWTIDTDNRLSENDGLGNMNSVFYKTNILFTLPAFTNAKKIYLAGSFNNWEPRELLLNETVSGWQLPLYLADGTHTYRYIVDGKWMSDPQNKETLPNEFNDVNSVIRIGKSYLFFLEGYTDARQVVLSGSFNKWRNDELYMKKTAKGWELPYTLGPGNYLYRFIVDNKWVSQPGLADKNGNSYFIIEPNYTFRLKGFPHAKNVYLAGEFNDWSPNTFLMKREGDEWVFTAHLSTGKHLYKFVIDGKWILDPANKLWEQNEHNTGNSVIWFESD